MKIVSLLTLMVCLVARTGMAAVTVSANEHWTNLFFGEEAFLNYTITSDESFQGMAGWKFSIHQRTMSSGEAIIKVSHGQFQPFAVRIPVPQAMEGILLPGLVTISVYDNRSRNVVASLEKQIWIYSKDPFQEKHQWLKHLNLYLFDPNKKTAEVLTKANIPYKEIFNREILPDIQDGVVALGEGLSLAEYPGLIQMLSKLATSGIPVICLAPAQGTIPIPAGASGIHSSRPSRMSFRQNDIIKQFGNKLDAYAWPPDGRVVKSSLHLTTKNESVAVLINQNQQGWPWMEIRYSNGNGRLLFCGFSIIEKWDAGPVPRHLFLRLLEYVVAKPKDRSGDG